MLLLNRSLLNRDCILINVLKALASIISISYRRLHRDILHYLQMQCFVQSVQDGTQAVDDCEKSKSPESYVNFFNIPAVTPGLHLAREDTWPWK
jgi:hypothetical protein